MKLKQFKIIEAKAKRLMLIDNRIWNKYGWTNGGMVDNNIHQNLERPLSQEEFNQYKESFNKILK